MEKLTERQRRVMDFLREYFRENGYPPTMREIGLGLGFTWPAARGHLRALERKGFIRLSPQRSRGIELLDAGREETLSLPLAGDIRAGEPILAVEDIQERISVDRNLFRDEGAFVLRVRGESMQEAGILDGDYVVVSPRQEVEKGGIGVALIGDEATVKKIYAEKGRITLVPCNSSMSPVRYAASEVKVIGRVTGVIRRL